MKNIEEIAALLIDQRKKLGIEQKDMYMRICIKLQLYQRIEVGSDVIRNTIALALALALALAQSSGWAGIRAVYCS